jgi:hypothetical protein
MLFAACYLITVLGLEVLHDLRENPVVLQDPNASA